jgi:hypothetical protein
MGGGIPLASTEAEIVSFAAAFVSAVEDAFPSVQAPRITAPKAGKTDQRTLFFILLADRENRTWASVVCLMAKSIAEFQAGR